MAILLLTYTGSYLLTPEQQLQNLLFVPDFKYNLLSVSKLIQDLHCAISFLPGVVIFQALSYGTILGIGHEVGGLYILQNRCTIAANTVVKSLKNSPAELLRWDHRQRHVSYTKMLRMSSLGLTDSSYTMFCIKECCICPIAKQSHLPFSDSDSHASLPFAILHMDLLGPYKISTINGY